MVGCGVAACSYPPKPLSKASLCLVLSAKCPLCHLQAQSSQQAWLCLVSHFNVRLGCAMHDTLQPWATVCLAAHQCWFEAHSHVVQVQMFALESLFSQSNPAYKHAFLPMPCILESVMPAFCQGISMSQASSCSPGFHPACMRHHVNRTACNLSMTQKATVL